MDIQYFTWRHRDGGCRIAAQTAIAFYISAVVLIPAVSTATGININRDGVDIAGNGEGLHATGVEKGLIARTVQVALIVMISLRDGCPI